MGYCMIATWRVIWASSRTLRCTTSSRSIAGAGVHEPWKHPDGPPDGYPAPMVDHGVERVIALERYAAATGTR